MAAIWFPVASPSKPRVKKFNAEIGSVEKAVIKQVFRSTLLESLGQIRLIGT